MNDLPKGWTTVALGDVSTINPKPAEKPNADDPVSFVPMAELHADAARTSQGTTRPFHEVSKGYRLFQQNDLLVAKITPCFQNNKIGQARISHNSGAGSTEFHVVHPLRGSVDDRYLLHFLRQDWIRVEGERKMTGSGGQRRVPQKFLERLSLPLPPLNEQRRIATILDKAQELVSAAYRATEHTQRIAHSQFDRLLRNSPKYQEAKLRDVLVHGLTNGLSPSTNGTVPGRVLTLSAVSSGTLKPDESKDVLFEKEPSPKQLVCANRLMITRGSGNPELVGVGTLGHDTSTELAFPDTVMGGTINTDAAAPEYVAATWNSGLVKAQIRSIARTTNGTFKVNQNNLSQISFPLLPREAQERFAETAQYIQAHLNVLRGRSERLELLGRALQSRAFRGEL